MTSKKCNFRSSKPCSHVKWLWALIYKWLPKDQIPQFLLRVAWRNDDSPISWAIFTASSAVCREQLTVTDREPNCPKLLRCQSSCYIRKSVRRAPNRDQKSSLTLTSASLCYVCLYLHDSIKTWDSVDLSSLSDKLALYLIPHGMDGMGVWPNEHHTLCCLVTKQSEHVPYYSFNTWNAKMDKQPPTSLCSTTTTEYKAELGLHINEIVCGTLKIQDALHHATIYTLIRIYKINEGKYIMGERLKETTINVLWAEVNQFRANANKVSFKIK